MGAVSFRLCLLKVVERDSYGLRDLIGVGMLGQNHAFSMTYSNFEFVFYLLWIISLSGANRVRRHT